MTYQARTVRRKRLGRSAKVAELVDALALGASGVTRESSSLSFRTNVIYGSKIRVRYKKSRVLFCSPGKGLALIPKSMR